VHGPFHRPQRTEPIISGTVSSSARCPARGALLEVRCSRCDGRGVMVDVVTIEEGFTTMSRPTRRSAMMVE
jgi:hypothetical protein